LHEQPRADQQDHRDPDAAYVGFHAQQHAEQITENHPREGADCE
jgi:hypothetical protein